MDIRSGISATRLLGVSIAQLDVVQRFPDICNSQWNFWSQPDPTHGLVNYLNKADALAAGLVSVKNGSFTLAVDDTTQLAQGTPRNS